MRIAVTGSNGFVGRHLLARWTAQGHALAAVSRSRPSVPGVSVWRSVPDYRDERSLVGAFEGSDVVVHLAARAHVLAAGSLEAEAAGFRAANVDAAVAVAHAARQAGCARVVLVSSIGVLGNCTAERPFDDTSLPFPLDPYAHSKLAAERAMAATLGGGPAFVIVRPPLVYGPGCPGNFRQLVGLVRQLPVLPFGGLRRQRSFIGVANLADALHLAATHPQCAGRSFVLADGEDTDVATLVSMIAAGLGQVGKPSLAVPEALLRTSAVLIGRRANFDKLAAELRVDASGFRAATGWCASVSLTQGVTEMARSFAVSASCSIPAR